MGFSFSGWSLVPRKVEWWSYLHCRPCRRERILVTIFVVFDGSVLVWRTVCSVTTIISRCKIKSEDAIDHHHRHIKNVMMWCSQDEEWLGCGRQNEAARDTWTHNSGTVSFCVAATNSQSKMQLANDLVTPP